MSQQLRKKSNKRVSVLKRELYATLNQRSEQTLKRFRGKKTRFARAYREATIEAVLYSYDQRKK
jgi:hypothetical protein